jgi:hypothetical protein
MPQIVFRCPACHGSLKTRDLSLVGKRIRCPKCGEPAEVPPPGTPLAAKPAPALDEAILAEAVPEDLLETPPATRGLTSPAPAPAADVEDEEDRVLRRAPPRPRKRYKEGVVAVAVGVLVVLYLAALAGVFLGAFDTLLVG